jgi:acetoin utilization protein AcuB
VTAVLYHRVKEWMSRDVVTIGSGASLREADELMSGSDLGHLPAVDDGEIVGIVSLGDMREARQRYVGAEADTVTVRDVMTEDPITINPDASMGLAAQIMLQTKARGLPVADSEGRLVGMLSSSDVFRMVVRDWQEESSLQVVGK